MKRLPLVMGMVLVAALLGCDDSRGGAGKDDDATGAECGNGIVEEGEECDGTDLGGATCEELGYTGGTLRCTPECRLDSSACFTCGNGIAEEGETCDRNDLRGNTCSMHGFDSGELRCAPNCDGFDTSGCGTCGNGSVDGAEECDGLDLGGATCADLGFWDPHGSRNLRCTDSCSLDTAGCDHPVEVCAGDTFGCTVLASGEVWCWGEIAGQTGPIPAQVSLGVRAEHISCGSSHACAMLEDGTIACWGANSHHQCSQAGVPTVPTTDPTTVDLPSGYTGWVTLDCGADTCCAIASDGAGASPAFCWGRNDRCQAGYANSPTEDCPATTGDTSLPTKVVLDGAVTYAAVDVAVSGTGGCLLRSDGTVWCWGRMPDRQVDTYKAYGIEIPGASSVSSLFYAGRTLCMQTLGTIECTGADPDGITGTGQTHLTSPTQLPAAAFLHDRLRQVGSVSMFNFGESLVNMCISSDVTWCWGKGTFGLNANGSTLDDLSWDDVLDDGSGAVDDGAAVGPFVSVGVPSTRPFVCATDGRGLACWGEYSSALGFESSEQVIATPTRVTLP